VRLLSDPKVPYPGVVELLGKTADPVTREQAGAVLVKRAGGGTIPPAMWNALSQVGGKTVVEFLKRKVESGAESDALAAAQALQNTPKDPSLVPWALRLAADPKLNKGVRDEMFGLCEHLGGPQARDGLIRIIANDKEELVRYRAFEAALAVGKAPAIQPALESLPAAASFKKEDIVDYLVKDVEKVGATARPALLKTLGSSAPLARLVAALALAKLGTASDAPAVEKLAGDAGKIKGLPPADTVGKEAARVAAQLRNKTK
jgi:HEAT repeat protein